MRSEFGPAFRQALDEFDDTLSDIVIGDLDKGSVELQTLAAVDKFQDKGFRFILRETGCFPAAFFRDARCILEEKLHWHAQNLRHGEKTACADPVGASRT